MERTLEALFAHESSEALAGTVLKIASELPERESKIVLRLWQDRNYLAVRCKIIAMDLEDDESSNRRETVASWAREAYDEVGRYR